MGALSTELQTLGRELALLAARDPEGDLSAVVLGEIERLGTGVERLTELLRLAEARPVPAGEGEEPEQAAPGADPAAEEAPS
jgi:hypothetical protein